MAAGAGLIMRPGAAARAALRVTEFRTNPVKAGERGRVSAPSAPETDRALCAGLPRCARVSRPRTRWDRRSLHSYAVALPIVIPIRAAKRGRNCKKGTQPILFGSSVAGASSKGTGITKGDGHVFFLCFVISSIENVPVPFDHSLIILSSAVSPYKSYTSRSICQSDSRIGAGARYLFIRAIGRSTGADTIFTSRPRRYCELFACRQPGKRATTIGMSYWTQKS